VVFPKHAEVTRAITVDAATGDNTVVFNSLVPVLNPHTLRASVSDGARITGTEVRTVYLKESLTEEISRLDKDILALSDDIAAEKRVDARLQESAAFYASVKGRLSQDMGRELAGGGVSVADWKQVLGFVSDGLADCDRQVGELAVRLRDKQQALETLNKQRKEYSSRQPKEMKQASVSFTSDAPGQRQVEVHYVVDTVIWQPSYDVHLDRAQGEIEVTGYGQVIQWSGEHWKDVQLTLAMSRPDFELTLPELTPVQASLDDKELATLAKEQPGAALASQRPDSRKVRPLAGPDRGRDEPARGPLRRRPLRDPAARDRALRFLAAQGGGLQRAHAGAAQVRGRAGAGQLDHARGHRGEQLGLAGAVRLGRVVHR
jgi:uncharacterized protein (TIGR02231 family)